MRATLSTMVLFSTGMRLIVFAFAGLVLADRLLAFAMLFPFVLAGLWAGSPRASLDVARESTRRNQRAADRGRHFAARTRSICCLSNSVRSPALDIRLLRFSVSSATAR
jgi:hypothetical protein